MQYFLSGEGEEGKSHPPSLLSPPPSPPPPHQFQRFPTVSLHQFPSICFDGNNYSQKFCALFSVAIGRDFFFCHSPTRSFNKKFKSWADWYGDIYYGLGGGGKVLDFQNVSCGSTNFAHFSLFPQNKTVTIFTSYWTKTVVFTYIKCHTVYILIISFIDTK